MIRSLTLVSVMTLVMYSCGKAPVYEVDPELLPYVNQFQGTAAQYGHSGTISELVAKFGPMSNPRERAFCDLVDGEPPTVMVNAETWETLDEASRESLMFHELGHCILKRVHMSERNSMGTPVSVMNPYAIDSETYEKHHDEYVAELFTGKKGVAN